MNRVVVSALAILVIAGMAGAATVTCPAPPNAGVPVDVTGLTITCGGLTFSNFQVIPAAGNPNPSVSLVSASTSNGTVDLQFNPNLSAPTGSQDIHFYYAVSGSFGNGVDLTVGGVNATIIERVCDTAFNTTTNTCSGTQLANIVAFSNPPGPNTATASFSTNASQLFVYKDVGVTANQLTMDQGGALTSFTQSWGGGKQVVPEPASMLLIGAGFMALGFLRRRVHKA